MERRVTSVELRPINLLTSGQIAGALTGEDETLDGGPSAVVSPNAPNQYKAVVDGYYYSPNVAGKPRVELYFEADPGLEKDKTITVSGINTLNNSGSPVDIDISNSYKVLEVDPKPFDSGRDTYNGKRHTPGSTIETTALFNPKIDISYSTRRQLIVKRRISTVEATTTTAKIVFTQPNYFKVGDIVFVGTSSEIYYGIDGLFRVKSVGSDFITYDFDAPIQEPINVASITEEEYVHAVAQSAITNGATWFDTSQDPDVAYVWDDYRWVLFGSSTVTKDTVKPGPVEDIEATDSNDTPPGSAQARSRVTLSWTAPSTDENGDDLVDLIGYTIWSRQYTTQEWEKVDITGPETTWAKGGFEQGEPAYFRVFARDSGGNLSEGVDKTHTTGIFAPEVAQPKPPAVTTYLGTIKISYDDLTANNLVQAASAKEIEVFFSDAPNFTVGPDNFYGTFPANAGSYIIIPGTELVQNEPLADGTDYYIRIRVRDIYGNITPPSDPPVAIRVKLSNIITYDMIDVGTLTGQVIIGLDIRTSSNPSVSGGVIMNQQGITAYNPSGGQTFRINALNGAVSIGDYLGKSEAAGLYIAENVADGKFATKPSSGTYITDIQAGQIFLSQTSASTNYVTKVSAGTLYLAKGGAAGDINSNSTTIDGGKITTGSLNANRIGAGTIDANVISVVNINANNIDVGTLTGRTVRTNSVGQRVIISSNPDNYIEFYNASSLQGVLTTSSGGEFIMQRNSGSGSGRVILTTAAAELSSGANSIGVCGPAKAYVVANSSQQVRVGCDVGSGALYLNFPTQAFSSGGDRYMIMDYAGKVKYLSSFPSNLSDVRLKNLTEDAPLGIDFISKLKPVSFTWKPETKLADPGVKQFGLVAQEVEQALVDVGVSLDSQQIVSNYGDDSYLDLVESSTDNSQMRTVNYTALVPVLIKSTQELLDRIKVLEEEVTILKERQSDAN